MFNKSDVTRRYKMKSLYVSTQKNGVQVRVAALVLVLVALMLPQFAWADHASDHPDGQFNSQSSFSAIGASELMDAAFLAANPEVAAFRRYAAAQQRAALAANPELAIYRRYAASQQGTALSANPELAVYRRYAASQLGAGLSAYYADGDAAFVDANPELRAYWRYVSENDCSIGLLC
jgi:hypothetical protein